jgi:hypothetical protein
VIMLNKEGLKRVLEKRPLLLEEIKMWLDIGFYIEPSSLDEVTDAPSGWTLWDFTGTGCELTTKVGHNLREMVIFKWENQGLWPSRQKPLSDEETNEMIALEERSKS